MTAIIVIIIIIWTQFCFHEKFQNVLAIEKMLGLLELKRRIGEWLQFCKLIVQTSGHRCWWLSRRWLCGSRKRGEDRVQFTRIFSELVDKRMESRCPAKVTRDLHTTPIEQNVTHIYMYRSYTTATLYIFTHNYLYMIYTQQRQNKTSPISTCRRSTHMNNTI